MVKEEKKLLWTEYINKAIQNRQWFLKHERLQYRTDVTALMCRGLDVKDTNVIKYGLWTEKAFFLISRAYVPFALFMMYRRGVFTDNLTSYEVRSIIKIAISMHCIDLFGHFLFRL